MKQVSNNTRKMIVLSLALAGFVWASISAYASVNVVAWYQLGEADPGAAATLPGANPTIDSSGNSYNLTASGSPYYSADTSPLAAGSTLSMQLNNATGDYYARANPVTTATADVAFEVWAKPVNALAPYTFSYVAYNGFAGHDGYGFIQGGSGSKSIGGGAQDNEWYAYLGATFIDLGPVTADQWVHLGMAFDSSGDVSVYRDDVFLSSDGTASTPTKNAGEPYAFEIGANNLGGQYFAGEVDQVRLFTFTGTFDPTDFLYTIPEPSIGLLVIGGSLLLWWWRSRR